jgi:uncharacterized protein YndB with AHSA1/START domain/predicted enzyme related to lactoylglutathione lyase
MNQTNSTTLTIRRFIPAPPARVFAAFTNPDDFAKWMGPEQNHCREAKLDARAGGAWQATMRNTHEAGGADMVVRGKFLEVRPPERLVFTWGWADGDAQDTVDSQVTVDFHELDGGTDLHLTHERLANAGSRDRHTHGWTGSIDKLAQLCAPETEKAACSGMTKMGEFGWNELSTTDTAAAQGFYTQLFGWSPSKMPGGEVDYTIFSAGGEMAAGMMNVMQPGSPAYWLGYVMVADCDASAAQAEKLGGKICLPPKDIPNVGRIAIFTDPQGAALGLFQPVAR